MLWWMLPIQCNTLTKKITGPTKNNFYIALLRHVFIVVVAFRAWWRWETLPIQIFLGVRCPQPRSRPYCVQLVTPLTALPSPWIARVSCCQDLAVVAQRRNDMFCQWQSEHRLPSNDLQDPIKECLERGAYVRLGGVDGFSGDVNTTFLRITLSLPDFNSGRVYEYQITFWHHRQRHQHLLNRLRLLIGLASLVFWSLHF